MASSSFSIEQNPFFPLLFFCLSRLPFSDFDEFVPLWKWWIERKKKPFRQSIIATAAPGGQRSHFTPTLMIVSMTSDMWCQHSCHCLIMCYKVVLHVNHPLLGMLSALVWLFFLMKARTNINRNGWNIRTKLKFKALKVQFSSLKNHL